MSSGPLGGVFQGTDGPQWTMSSMPNGPERYHTSTGSSAAAAAAALDLDLGSRFLPPSRIAVVSPKQVHRRPLRALAATSSATGSRDGLMSAGESGVGPISPDAHG